MSEPVLRVTDLSVSFPMLVGSVRAVRECSLEVGRGEIVGLVGESGSGKSIIASACLGLVPKPGIVSGSVLVCGREVVGRSEEELSGLRGGEVAMIFQNPATSLNPYFTIGQQMTDIVGRQRSLSRREAAFVCVEALGDVRMADPKPTLQKYPHQLSGGQIQRVMIALAIACRPKLLIADEPTTALDVTIQAQIIVLLRDLVDRLGLSVLFITHDFGVVAALCERVVVMYAGTVIETADAVDLFENPAHPFTEKLLHTVPRLGMASSKLEAIPGQVPNLSSIPEGCVFSPRCDRRSDVCMSETPIERTLANDRTVACHHVLGQAMPEAVGGAR